MKAIEQTADGWIIRGGDMVLVLGRKTGCLTGLTIGTEKPFEWTHHDGDVTVRDDRLQRTFGRRQLQKVRFAYRNDTLRIEKHFKDAPWRLDETYSVERGAIQWDAQVTLNRGDYRSCEVSYRIPWPQPLYPVQFWAARDNMPSAPHRFANISLEYGEVTSGILIPALVSYMADQGAGLLLAMPFDFKTPRFRFLSGYREPDLQASFDWLALSPGKPARTSLLLRGTGGAWRPALGWLYERFKEYFEPRSTLIDKLWGGHVSGNCNVSLNEAKTMARLGLRWHEVHVHFPAYGNYHPEGMDQWRSGHLREDETLISVDMVRRTIANLHKAGSAALPYIQVSGDGDTRLLDSSFEDSRVRDLYGEAWSTWPGTTLLNSDPALGFGQDMHRQIKGMVARYPEMDGVFLDQAGYNFTDTAHDDGMTAIDNRPCYMTGLNYYPHLEHLSKLLHPKKAIIANGPHSIGIMKYIDGFMAEGSTWLCDLLQWYSLAKPMFFLMYHTTDRDIELMFQRCLIYGAGYSSYAAAMPSKTLYDRYVPLVERLFRRRWVFDAEPLAMPTGFKGNVFRSPSGNLLAGIVSEQIRSRGRRLNDNSIAVKTADVGETTHVTLQQPGGKIARIPFVKANGVVQFDVPGDFVAAVAELHIRKH